MDVFKLIPNHLIDENIYLYMDMIQTCYDALDEGVTDPSVVDIARNNSTSMVLSYLDRSYYLLEKYYETLLSYLNNFTLNFSKLVEKYKVTIIDKYNTNNSPIVYNTYQYPKQRDKYPKILTINSKWYQLLSDAREFDTENNDSNYFNVKVNNTLQEFTQSYLGKKLKADSLEKETKEYTYETLRGVTKTIGLTPNNISDIINNIVDMSKEMQKELKSTKAAYTKDYKTLEKFLNVYPNEPKSLFNILSIMKRPEEHRLEIAEMQRFSTINMEINRLMTGFVTVYSTAFSERTIRYR